MKIVKKILIKINLFRKWLRSFFTHKHLSATLYSKLFYNHENRTWKNTYWLGKPLWKMPLDLWVYQEIIYELKPDKIVECGTNRGGSAFYMATICDLINHGEILTVDIKKYPEQPQHPRIKYFVGSSVDPDVFSEIKKHINPGEKILVILDSAHGKDHVIKELEMYGTIVNAGSYMILEDTSANGYPVYPSFGPGPMEALREYLKTHDEFVVDKDREKYYVTWNPNGYLKRVNPVRNSTEQKSGDTIK